MDQELDRDNEQFNQGVTHTVELLAKTIGSEGWVAGDGSEDYDADLAQTLLNILTAKGLYDPEDGVYAMVMPQASPESRMIKIEKLIEMCQSTRERWGNTCVYIRRGGMQWGAVALNAQADDEKHGVFDLQAEQDRDRARHAGQVQRLMADRDQWRDRALAAEKAT